MLKTLEQPAVKGTYKVIADLHRQLWGMLKGKHNDDEYSNANANQVRSLRDMLVPALLFYVVMTAMFVWVLTHSWIKPTSMNRYLCRSCLDGEAFYQ